MSETETRDEPMAGSPLCDADGHAWVWTWPIEGGEGAVGQCSLCGRITTAERDAAVRAEVERLRGVVEAVRALADGVDHWTPYATRDIGEAFLAVSVHDLVADIHAALASIPSSGGTGERAAIDLVPCCDHCGCAPGNRDGHDDTCKHGCNDAPASPEPTGADAPVVYSEDRCGVCGRVLDCCGGCRCEP